MKWCSLVSACLGFAATAQAATAWQQRNETFPVADAPIGVFSNFTSKADAVASLELTLNSSKISRQGDFRYGQTIARIWTEQRKIWPELILYPENTVDVSVIMQFYSVAHTFWGDNGFAISTYSPQNFHGLSISQSFPIFVFVSIMIDLGTCSGRRSCRLRRSTVSQCHNRPVSSLSCRPSQFEQDRSR